MSFDCAYKQCVTKNKIAVNKNFFIDIIIF